MSAVDLVVVGAGAGGMTAALAAALHGLRVVLWQTSDQVGGTTATSAGTLWVPGNRQGEAAGHGDSAADAGRYLDSLIGPDDPRGLRRTYLADAADTLAEIEARTRLRFVSAGLHPDYLQAQGAALAGRALSPVEFDGSELGAEDFRRIRPPMRELMVLGGMMANKADVQALFSRWRTRAGFVRSAQLVLRYARDRLRHPRGTRLVLGNALVARLLASLRDAGVEIRSGQRFVQLLPTQGRIDGAVFEVAGRRETLRARRGVVLATGGIGHDTALRAALAPEGAHRYSLDCDSVRGEGIAAARRFGASFERHRGDFFWQPVSVVPHRGGAPGLFPHLYLDRAKPGLIAVDDRERRFVDEDASYHHFVEGMTAASGPQALAYLICDAEFHKGDSPLGRFNGDPTHLPNPCLGPIATAPFCVLPVWAADAASSSGLVTDAHGAVLDADAHPIPGLYACGNDMASLMRGTYPSPGTTLGPALVFGWRCGIYAATQAERPMPRALEAA